MAEHSHKIGQEIGAYSPSTSITKKLFLYEN